MSVLGTAPFPIGSGRTYSAYDFDRGVYKYYQDPRGNPDHQGWDYRPGPAAGTPVSPIGDPIESLLTELPRGIRPIGSGAAARGEVGVINRHQAVWGKRNIPGGAGIRGLDGPGEEVPSDLYGREPSKLQGARLPTWLLWIGAAAIAYGFVHRLRLAR